MKGWCATGKTASLGRLQAAPSELATAPLALPNCWLGGHRGRRASAVRLGLQGGARASASHLRNLGGLAGACLSHQDDGLAGVNHVDEVGLGLPHRQACRWRWQRGAGSSEVGEPGRRRPHRNRSHAAHQLRPQAVLAAGSCDCCMGRQNECGRSLGEQPSGGGGALQGLCRAQAQGSAAPCSPSRVARIWW